MAKRRWFMGFRFKKLTQLAYREAGIEPPQMDIIIAKFPKSWVDKISKLSYEKNIDYNFIGCVYINKGVERNRQWLLEFVKEHFTDNSYFRLNSTEDLERHEALGDFDHTFSYGGDRFVEKYFRLNLRRIRFDRDYYEVMGRSKFTMCPAGDEPYSQRFTEAIMSKSIPILEDPSHCCAYPQEVKLGYKFYLLGDDYVYRQDWVDYNYDVFLKKQTLVGDEN